MVVLDTDHLSLLLLAESEAAEKIAMRLASRHIRELTTTIVTYEEQTRGWLAQIARARNLPQEIETYRRLKTSAPWKSSTSTTRLPRNIGNFGA